MKEIIKYWKKWSRDPDIQETIYLKQEKQDFKIKKIEIYCPHCDNYTSVPEWTKDLLCKHCQRKLHVL